MAKITKKMALDYHMEGKPGKIEINPTKPYQSQTDLSLAYSPGVAYPCLEIQENEADAYRYTNKGNLMAVISNGTAVLGLGNIGALAGKPVMEGKALLFKIFAGLDCFDIEVDEHDPEKFIHTVKAISPTFGGINLEDIKAPECFEIERRLKAECNIPVMHDDQHGTAIITLAGLINALKLVGKKKDEIRVVTSGAGAAATAITKLLLSWGIRDVIMCDRAGAIYEGRLDHMNPAKEEMAKLTNREKRSGSLADMLVGADVFIGVSAPGTVTADMVRSMNRDAIIFACANPTPEIFPDEA